MPGCGRWLQRPRRAALPRRTPSPPPCHPDGQADGTSSGSPCPPFGHPQLAPALTAPPADWLHHLADEADAEPEVDLEEDEEVVEKPARPDGGTYLSMYFRDMAVLDVLRPEEEFTSAREIEALEIMLWEAVLAHPPAIERMLDAVADSARLRRCRSRRKTLRRLADEVATPKAIHARASAACGAQAARGRQRSPVHRSRARRDRSA